MAVGTGCKLLQHELGSMCCSHLDMELSEVRSLGDRIVLKLRLGCDTAQHKQTKSHSVNEEDSTDEHHSQFRGRKGDRCNSSDNLIISFKINNKCM